MKVRLIGLIRDRDADGGDCNQRLPSGHGWPAAAGRLLDGS